MKVLLFQNVPGIGRANEIQDVSAGYARNFLLPRRLATLVTPAVLAEHQKRQATEEAQQTASRQEQDQLAAKLPALRPVVLARANEKGQLYGRVSADDIVAALKKSGVILPLRTIQIDQPLTRIGEYPVMVVLRSDLHVSLILSIQPA